MVKNLSMIVAISEDKAIGNNGGLLCRLSGDLKNFKAVTMGHAVIMGRKTFESLPKGALPGRRNLVITHNSNYMADNVQTAMSLQQAIALTEFEQRRFIIGGATIYREALPLVEDIYLTLIHAEYPNADTRLPEFNMADWQIESETHYPADEKNEHSFTIMHLIRK